MPSFQDVTLEATGSTVAGDGKWRSNDLVGAFGGVGSNVKLYNIALTTAGRLSFYIDYSELTGVGTHTFYVTRTHGTVGSVSVDFDSYGDTHTTASGTITFADGQAGIKSFTVAVPTKADAGDHRIYVQLSNPTNSAVLHNGTKTIAYGVIDDGTVPADTAAVFFDTAAGSNGSGTAASPYDNYADAKTNVGSKRYICGKGTITPSETITFGGGSVGSGISVPATRTSEATRLYIQKWSGFNLSIDGTGDTTSFGFYTNSGESYHTYKGIDIANLNMTGAATVTPCFGIAYHYGESTDINIEYCSGDDINGGNGTNVSAFLLYGVNGAKVWRSTANDIQVADSNTNGNTGGVYSYDGKNLSIQRCTFTNVYNGHYHKNVLTVGDTASTYKFNDSDTAIGAHYGGAGGGSVGHSYAVIQSNIFKNATDAAVRHTPGTSQTDTGVNKSFYITNNVFDTCGVGTVPAIYSEKGFEQIFFNNIFLDCRATWGDKNDQSAIKTPAVEYADYNNDFGTTLTSQRYLLLGTSYSTSGSLPATLTDNDTQVDPQFTNDEAGDYSLAAGSNSLTAGIGGTDQGIYLTGIEVIGS